MTQWVKPHKPYQNRLLHSDENSIVDDETGDMSEKGDGRLGMDRGGEKVGRLHPGVAKEKPTPKPPPALSPKETLRGPLPPPRRERKTEIGRSA